MIEDRFKAGLIGVFYHANLESSANTEKCTDITHKFPVSPPPYPHCLHFVIGFNQYCHIYLQYLAAQIVIRRVIEHAEF